MPYWIHQSEGSHTHKIQETVQLRKAGRLNDDEAWKYLSELYKVVNNCEPPKFDLERGKDNIKYMIYLWFPMYANMFCSGHDLNSLLKRIPELETKFGGKFEFAYEY